MNFPKKKYKTIVIDPPWFMPSVSPTHNVKFKVTGSLPYELMKDEDLRQFPINQFADENCQLFLWVTHGTMQLGFELLKAWNFKYHCLLTWDKTKGVVMCGFNRRTEYVIFGYKGKLNIKLKGVSIPTFFREKSTVHSRKPRIFYDMPLKSTPEPRIDIFARKRHFGFDAWGNQVEEVQSLEAFT
tara:strand:- start:14 stop:568 length:555 start_codon:yes stop_codon:yes gene_type:complete